MTESTHDPDYAFCISHIDLLKSLVPKLPRSLSTATVTDRISTIFDSIPVTSDEPWPVFNHRMDLLFGEDTRNKDGRLVNIQRGPLGMDLVMKYFHSITTESILWGAAKPKFKCLTKELNYLMYVFIISILELKIIRFIEQTHQP